MLHSVVPGGELKEVAAGQVIRPKSTEVMHNVKMGKDIMRVSLTYIVPEYRDILPPFNPPGAEDNTPLHECTNWVMPWLKSQIRLGGRGILWGQSFPQAAPRSAGPCPSGPRRSAPRRNRRSPPLPPPRRSLRYRRSSSPGRNRFSSPTPTATKNCWDENRYRADHPKPRPLHLNRRHRNRCQ